MKVILTGATGYVGEGILLECLNSSEIENILLLGRKSTLFSDGFTACYFLRNR